LLSFKNKFPKLYNIGSSAIPRVDTNKDLGIIVSSNLLWVAHYNHIISKSYKVLGLYRIFPLQSYIKAKTQLLTALVRSEFSTVQLSAKVNYMAKQAIQDSNLTTHQTPSTPFLPTTLWTHPLHLLPPPLHHDSALWPSRAKSLCSKTAGAW